MIKNGVVKLVDFGFSNHHSRLSSRAISIVGKEYYMAPEVKKSRNETGYNAF